MVHEREYSYLLSFCVTLFIFVSFTRILSFSILHYFFAHFSAGVLPTPSKQSGVLSVLIWGIVLIMLLLSITATDEMLELLGNTSNPESPVQT